MVAGGGDAMNGPAKLRRKTPAGSTATRIDAPPKHAILRNPLEELSNGHLPAAHSRKGVKAGCFGFLLTNSSSSSSVSSTASSSTGVVPTSPKSAPFGSRALRPREAPRGPPEFRSGTGQRDVMGGASSGCRNLGWSQREVPSRKNRRRRGSGRLPLQEAHAVEGAPHAAARNPNVALRGDDGATRPPSVLGRGALPAGTQSSMVSLGCVLDHCGAQHCRGPVLDSTPRNGGQQPSISPASAPTTTPPVLASISPELGPQLVLFTSSCFAAGHLIAGVQDRRKCKPRGFLAGGDSGVETADGGWLRTSGSPGCGSPSASLTAPTPLEASVHWLFSSPCDNNGGRRRTRTAFSGKKDPSGFSLAEGSVHWFLSPLADTTGVSLLEDFPSAVSEPAGVSSEFGGLQGMNSCFDKSPSAFELCPSPTTNSSMSPFSLIIQKAAASATGRPHLHRGRGRGHCYGSVVNNSLFSGDSRDSSNLICTPSTCSCSSGQVGPSPAFDRLAMGEHVETLNPSSPLWKFLSSETKKLLSFSPPKPRGPSTTPPNSISLSCFRRPSRHGKSVKDESRAWKGRLPSSELRVSWREGLISRMFEMDEFNQNVWTSDEEIVGSHEEDDRSLEHVVELGSSMMEDAGGKFATDGSGSFEFLGPKQNAEKDAVNASSPTSTPCAESLRAEMDTLATSDDSEWKMYYKNNLFEP